MHCIHMHTGLQTDAVHLKAKCAVLKAASVRKRLEQVVCIAESSIYTALSRDASKSWSMHLIRTGQHRLCGPLPLALNCKRAWCCSCRATGPATMHLSSTIIDITGAGYNTPCFSFVTGRPRHHLHAGKLRKQQTCM